MKTSKTLELLKKYGPVFIKLGAPPNGYITEWLIPGSTEKPPIGKHLFAGDYKFCHIIPGLSEDREMFFVATLDKEMWDEWFPLSMGKPRYAYETLDVKSKDFMKYWKEKHPYMFD